MARYTGPKCRLSRREGTDLLLKSRARSLETKCKLETPPGQHGARRQRRMSDFALQLRYPPNPVRNLDNSLTAVQQDGFDVYHAPDTDQVASCEDCHTLDPANGFFGGEETDQDAPPGGSTVTLCLDAGGKGNLSVDILLAAESVNGAFDVGDFLVVEYAFDGGAWVPLIEFAPTASPNGSLSQDTDGNGVGGEPPCSPRPSRTSACPSSTPAAC